MNDTSTGGDERGVRFTPSKVAGVSGVLEVAVFPDRLELRGGHGWATVRLAELVPPFPPPTFFEKLLRADRRPRIAAIFFSRERYTDSFVRFLSDPPITIYMPADGPTQFPDSAFSRILRTLRSGGYSYYDADVPTRTDEGHERLPRWIRTLHQSIVLLCALNFLTFVAGTMYLGGSALRGGERNGRYYFGREHKPHRQREVSRQVWVFSYWHGLTALSGVGVMALTGAGVSIYVEARKRNMLRAAGDAASPREYMKK